VTAKLESCFEKQVPIDGLAVRESDQIGSSASDVTKREAASRIRFVLHQKSTRRFVAQRFFVPSLDRAQD
jgi:hypothetical protein